MLQSSSSASSSTHWGQCRAQQVKMSVCSRQTVCEHVWRDTTFRYCPMYERFCKSCEWEHMIANIDDMSFRYQSVDSTELFIMNTVFILLFFFSHIAKYVICRMLLQKSIFFFMTNKWDNRSVTVSELTDSRFQQVMKCHSTSNGNTAIRQTNEISSSRQPLLRIKHPPSIQSYHNNFK